MALIFTRDQSRWEEAMEPLFEPKSANVQIERLQPYQDELTNTPHENILERLSHEVFRHDHLDRKLKRHHITGIPFPLERN